MRKPLTLLVSTAPATGRAGASPPGGGGHTLAKDGTFTFDQGILDPYRNLLPLALGEMDALVNVTQEGTVVPAILGELWYHQRAGRPGAGLARPCAADSATGHLPAADPGRTATPPDPAGWAKAATEGRLRQPIPAGIGVLR
ncbi:hypothetical protein ACIBKY_24585 [Nonomuraea sp. NPDC050394]|uniref:hypothetical protein n=1 Tax=Nonomuraea sp. NPDC050394 TaxID=3364363 RepID=UPI0037B8C8FE